MTSKEVIINTSAPWGIRIDGHYYPVPSEVGRLLLELKEEIDTLRKKASKAEPKTKAK